MNQAWSLYYEGWRVEIMQANSYCGLPLCLPFPSMGGLLVFFFYLNVRSLPTLGGLFPFYTNMLPESSIIQHYSTLICCRLFWVISLVAVGHVPIQNE